MSGPDGQEPPHVPHCRQVIKVSAPGVLSITSARKDSFAVQPCMGSPRSGIARRRPRPAVLGPRNSGPGWPAKLEHLPLQYVKCITNREVTDFRAWPRRVSRAGLGVRIPRIYGPAEDRASRPEEDHD